MPPTWNKGQHHAQLANVWRSAAQHLSEVENIFIIGYSLPQTDEFFRFFYALGSVSPTLLRTVCIVDPDEENKVFSRFSEIFGPIALAPDCFRPLKKYFKDALPDIAKRLDLKTKSATA